MLFKELKYKNLNQLYFILRPELMKTCVLELNSSDERGIQVIRDKVKTFSQFTASGHRTEYFIVFHIYK